MTDTANTNTIAQIHHIRNSILQELITVCENAVDEAIRKQEVIPSTSCRKATCKATKVGIMMMGLRAAGLYPVPGSARTMNQSVTWYWRALKSIGADFKTYSPCDGTFVYGRGATYRLVASKIASATSASWGRRKRH